MKKIRNLSEARDFLYAQVPQFDKKKFPGELGLRRTKYLMKLLGDPQEKIKIIHVAGTSGKGSTAYFTSHILHGLGFKVGLSVSPHLVDIRERAQIDGKFLDEQEYVEFLNNLLPHFYAMKKTQYGAPTYFELVQALAFLVFYENKVDYAVIETGLGGLLDATNVVSSPTKICLITKIGLDHTKILGPKIKDIALQKAGIIQKGNVVLAVGQRKVATDVLKSTADLKGARFTEIKNQENFKNIKTNDSNTVFDFEYKGAKFKKLLVSTRGTFQAENASLALSAVLELAKRDKFKLDEEKLRDSLVSSYFPGRFDVKNIGNTTTVIDGAHNPQKMRAFLSSLTRVFPENKYDFILAFKKGKDYRKMLVQILPLAKNIYLTSFFAKSDMKDNMSEDTEILEDFLVKQGFTKVKKFAKATDALSFALSNSGGRRVVVTGSLYLSGEVYKALDKLKLKG